MSTGWNHIGSHLSTQRYNGPLSYDLTVGLHGIDGYGFTISERCTGSGGYITCVTTPNPAVCHAFWKY